MESDSSSEYEINFDEAGDPTNDNTGTDRFVVDHKYVDYKGFPDIYDPFGDHIELISNDVMNNILKYIAKNNNFKSIIPLRRVNKSMKNFVDDFMKMKGKKFYHRIIKYNSTFICDENCSVINWNNVHYRFYHKWRTFTLRLLNRRR